MAKSVIVPSPMPVKLVTLIAATLLTALDGYAAVPTAKVRMYFNMGPVEIELYGNESPLHVANFLTYVDAGDYDNSFIHRTRALDSHQPLGFDLFAQGGSFKVPTGYIIGSNPIIPRDPVPNEFDASNGLSNTPGSLAAARGGDPDSATSGWFINQTDNSNAFDPGPYTVFGQVTSGMDIIDAIPFLPNAQQLQGSGFESTPFYGDSLVTIERAVRIPVLAGDYDFSGSVNGADYNVWKATFGTSTSLAADGNGNGVVDAADYAVWRDSMAATPGPPGDYDGNMLVSEADYQRWRADFGKTVAAGTGADGNGNGVVDAADYSVWRDSMAAGGGASLVTVSVPEPAAAGLLLTGLAALVAAALRQRSRSRKMPAAAC